MSLHQTHLVSAKLIMGEEALCVADVIAERYPDARVTDYGSYLALEREGELIFDMASITDALGRPYAISTFLTILASYNGAIDIDDTRIAIREAN